MKIVLLDHDPAWAEMFNTEAEEITRALGSSLVAIYHIGSTAITGMIAKPIIDVLPVVQSIEQLDERTHLMEALEYEAMGEFGIPSRRYFRKNNAEGIRQFQVHAFEEGSLDITRHLAFRDYLRSHPEPAAQYSRLKQDLASKHPTDIEAYIRGKAPFIKTTEKLALIWRQNSI